MKIKQKLSLNYHQISSNTHLISSADNNVKKMHYHMSRKIRKVQIMLRYREDCVSLSRQYSLCHFFKKELQACSYVLILRRLFGVYAS